MDKLTKNNYLTVDKINKLNEENDLMREYLAKIFKILQDGYSDICQCSDCNEILNLLYELEKKL